MKILQKIWFVLLLGTFSSVYGCWDKVSDVDDCRVKAEQGDSKSQFILGLMYHKGLGVPQDYKEAIKWFRLAAEQGYAEAQYNLSLKDADGRGVPQDYKEAVKWFRLAAEQGYSSAQYNLAETLIQNGNHKEAVKWYRLAAEQGHERAQYIIEMLTK